MSVIKNITFIIFLLSLGSCIPNEQPVVKSQIPLLTKPNNEVVVIKIVSTITQDDIDKELSRVNGITIINTLSKKKDKDIFYQLNPVKILSPTIFKTLLKSKINYRFLPHKYISKVTENVRNDIKYEIIFEIQRFAVKDMYLSKINYRNVFVKIKCKLRKISNKILIWQSLINEKLEIHYSGIVDDNSATLKKLLSSKINKTLNKVLIDFK